MHEDQLHAGPSNASAPPEEHLFKILVIGDIGTGKTSIIKRYVHNFFSQHYRATIGVDFALKVINWDCNTMVRLQMWDIAGQERFGNMTRVYYKEAAGAFIVFDITRAATFEGVLKWKADLDSKVRLSNGNTVPAILLANKSDLDDMSSGITDSDLEHFCQQHGFIGWFKCSAKEGLGIDDAGQLLVQNILLIKQAGQYEIPVMHRDGNVHKLMDNNDVHLNKNPKKKACC